MTGTGTGGTGRRRRGVPADGMGGVPQAWQEPLQAPPPPPRDIYPPADPEHREHGSWGAAEDWAAARQVATAGSGAPRQAQASYLGAEAPARPGPAGPGARIPGPRREFVSAFDAPPAPPVKPSEPASFDEPDADEPGKPGKGKAFSGVMAAAVVTVLAAVVAGKLAGGGIALGESDTQAGTAARATEDDSASRSDGRATQPVAPSASQSAAPLTYAQVMAAQSPLDPDLKLSGKLETVGGSQKAPGGGTVLRFRVDVEKGLPLDGGVFTEAVFKTLNDKRSWGGDGTRTFERVSSGDADIVITLASPGTTAEWCAKSGLDTTVDNVSCDSASTERTMINAYRWAQGAETFGPDKMTAYREMLINHEVGHRLGYGHVVCPTTGALAPVMMQQTKFLTLGGRTCKPNAWPYPEN